ncbi:MAG TPA: PEP/pyruvate-binding domain-containing protein [Thermoanaerobaculia bacterium]|nr:PEP/pyruvate-binding domain-containing protein [Thermoanaerobaculia bacterium]HUM30729.1 PEP/pyruvate-binding domain-containing protein [Thermoanaerobaculia bacterium]HXK68982.1 PEP/pyruvate-binding domain-containing protein [Thermoanaerobaculia bacterium]
MTPDEIHADRLLKDLQERAKELRCLYEVEEILNRHDLPFDTMLRNIIGVIPPGWQYPEVCQAEIIFEDQVYRSDPFVETSCVQTRPIEIQGEPKGSISVSYRKQVPKTDGKVFLKEEEKLISTISDRIGQTIFLRKMRESMSEWKRVEEELTEKKHDEWRIVVEMIRRSDRKLYNYVTRKMLLYLCINGVESAKHMLQSLGGSHEGDEEQIMDEMNVPSEKQAIDRFFEQGDAIFSMASENLSESEILSSLQRWMQEDKSRIFVKTIDNPNTSLTQVIDVLTQYSYAELESIELSPPVEKGLRVSLVRRFFSDHLDFINVAKNFLSVWDYITLVKQIIYPADSHGKLGGKSAGLFLAQKVLQSSSENKELFASLKVPKTWYIASDGLLNFLDYNNLEEVYEQKYKDIDEVRLEYPNMIQVFKNSHFPPEILKGLSMAIDEIGECPIIVRSSSLLEDRMGAAFSGKYKSLFLANQGSKNERLAALTDAIAEVYASTFAPDPIQYRIERGLLDFHEEMGIMIQEVVGTRIGPYFIPSFAGVAFSRNEFRWSPRIKREDGLLRMVPGLGTRAVDRVADDYPVLLAPGNPNLRVNTSPEEVARYSSKRIDVINLEKNSFETLHIHDFLARYGTEIPGIQNIISVYQDDTLHAPTSLLGIDFERHNLVVTCQGLVERTPFIRQIRTILTKLEETIGTPVDIEFAHDGKDLYLLQCRPQSSQKDIAPSPIPQDIPEKSIVFSGNRHVSNGVVPEITHVVYIDGRTYNALGNLSDLRDVGRAVGQLNKILPKRKFILMGPGRWGSRGDIKLGVSVTYADINNTAMLIEIAQKTGNYTPELSFGTHFFQDLVETSIRYLPLYPDESEVHFDEIFLMKSRNIFKDLLPEFSHLENTIRVIDVQRESEGKILKILMNADLDQALAYLTEPSQAVSLPERELVSAEVPHDDYWRWRLRMAERIASNIDPERFGVEGFYVFGSTKNASAGPSSDIDLLIHFRGTAEQRLLLQHWLEGWSLTLAEINYVRTGYRSDGLLDVHIVTDEDIANKNSFAVKIGAVTDPARPLTLGSR